MTASALDVPPAARLVTDRDASTYRHLLRTAPTTHQSPIWFGPAARRYTAPDYVVPDPDTAIRAVDANEVLTDWWPGPCPDGCRCLEPFLGEFPGLVRADSRDRSGSATTVQAAMAFGAEAADMATLALVDAVRPADVPAVIGWIGTCNYVHQDLASLCAVLRSWEDRFGAVLTWLGGATLLLSVGSPPKTVVESERVAAEHFAFCPDQLDPQDGRDPFTPRSYARTIRGAELWRFWWD